MKVSKYVVISGSYFPVFGLNTEIYFVNLRIQAEYRKILTRNNYIFGHFSRSVFYAYFFIHIPTMFKDCVRYICASLFLSLNESTCQTMRNVFYFTSKALFFSRENQTLQFYIFKFHDVIKFLSIIKEIHFTE